MIELQAIFTTIRKEMAVYQPPFQPKHDLETDYDLWSFKDLVIEGRKYKEVYFAGIVIRKDYVGFYYMPVYAEPKIKPLFKPELLILLKGKSCFHIKKLDEALLRQIREALEAGFKQYKERGWV